MPNDDGKGGSKIGHFRLPDDTLTRLSEVRQSLSYPSDAATVRFAIDEIHRQIAERGVLAFARPIAGKVAPEKSPKKSRRKSPSPP
jgi:hypothetical protein